MNEIVLIIAEGHVHESGSILQETWNLITDPAHALTEIFYSLLFDLLLIPLVVLVLQKIREPRLKHQLHHEIDTEHGITHRQIDSKEKLCSECSALEFSP